MKASRLRRVLRLWPPFVFSGIRIEQLSDDWRYAKVRLKLRWYNRNYVRTQFGGSLFAMADPFWMILVMESLGRDYIVWDQAAQVEFVKPGRGTVQARFDLDDASLDAIREATATGGKHLHWFETEIRDADHEVVAHIRKRIYVRRKPAR